MAGGLLAMAALGFVMTKEPTSMRQTRLVGGHGVSVEYARTPAEQQQGLSGRDALAPDTALVFPFSPAATPTFWMRGMRFPIDIVWVAQGRVVGIEAGAPADDGAIQYQPPSPVDEVFELPAGWCATHGVDVGDTVE